MKFKNVYTLFALIALTIVIQGRSGGPATVANLEVTGAPGSTGDMGTCGNSGCHTSGAFNPSLTLLPAVPNTTEPISEYTPGETYWLDIITTANEGTPTAYGMQAVILDSNDSNAASWSFVPGTAQEVELSGRKYVEHNQASTSLDPYQLDWVAPPAGTGDITIYVSTLLSDLNGNTQGDGVATASITLTEAKPSSITQIDRDFATIDLFPNPIVDRTTVSITSEEPGDYQMNVLNTVGQILQSEKINLQAGQNERNLNVSDLQSGLYFLQIVGDEKMSTQQLIKL